MGLFMKLLFAVALSEFLLCMAEPKVHNYDFVLTNINFTRLCSTKSALVVNETIPGPVVYVNRGDRMYVNVHNKGDFKVTIHWHGVKQPKNPWSDGPEYITQCSIRPGNNFTYEVIFSDEEGTLWWHAHNDWTRNTVHGVIIIYPAEGNSYPFPKPDAEEVFVIGSWYTYDVNLRVEKALTTGEIVPEADAHVINGQPGDFYNCSKDSTYRFEVEYGKTYHLRILNAAMNAQFFFGIADHNLTVVGMDGSYLKRFDTSYIVLSTGQTMDVLITANQSLSHYYIIATLYSLEDPSFISDTFTSAILQYKGNYTPPDIPNFPYFTLPTSRNETAANRFRYNLRNLSPLDVPKNITTRMYITTAINQNNFTDASDPDNVTSFTNLAASLNNMTWMNHKIDVLNAYYNNISGVYTEDFPDMPPTFYDFTAENVSDDYIPSTLGTKAKVLEYGEEVEMIYQNTNVLGTTQDHPMHLHGHTFYVVGFGNGNFDFEEDPKTFNLVDPPVMNTATLPVSGWLALRFRAFNPGVWLWHCHYDHHLSYGMNYVIIVKNGGTPATSILPPPPYMPPCGQDLDLLIKDI